MGYKIGLREKRKKVLEEELKRIVPILVELGAKKIVLFGSLATGSVTKSSDLDLFIVMDTEKDFMSRIDDIYRVCRPRIAVDFFVYTPDEIRSGRVSPLLLKEVVEKGKVLYEERQGL